MQVSGTGVADKLTAATLAPIVAEILSVPLPQPDLVSMYVSTSGVSFQFSATGSGEARFGYVREWADHYGLEVTRSGRFHEVEFYHQGIEFKFYAAEPENGR